MIVERKTDIVRLIKSLEADHPDQKYIAIPAVYTGGFVKAWA